MGSGALTVTAAMSWETSRPERMRAVEGFRDGTTIDKGGKGIRSA
jgi:hypothetical protein